MAVSPAAAAPDELAHARDAISGLRIPFVENRGQLDAKVAFSADTFAGSVFVTRAGELVYSFPGKVEQPKSEHPMSASNLEQRGSGWVLSETLVGAADLKPAATDRSVTQVSRFVGNKAAGWQQGLATYDRVELGQAWDGIDVALYAHGDNVEKLFTVNPGADPDQIQVRISGGKELSVNRGGELVVRTGNGDVAYTRPMAYQVRGGRREAIEVAYALNSDGYAFRLGDYDRTRPVYIDPLLRATYLGTAEAELAFDIQRAASSGDIYLAGTTCSSGFPETVGGAQAAASTSCDGFVARLKSDLTDLLQATYVGGAGREIVLRLSLTADSVYVAGYTCSSDFPKAAGGAQATYGGGACPTVADGFIAKLDPSLTSLVQSTYLGGSADDVVRDLVVTGDSVYAAGYTCSANFPETAGGAQTSSHGGTSPACYEGFVAKLNTGLTDLAQATYLGGAALDGIYAMAVAGDNVYVAGDTASTDLPNVTGAPQTTNGGKSDGFVGRFNGALTTLTRASYLGGAEDDQARALVVNAGEVYVGGITASVNLPGAAGGGQPALAGNVDGYVVLLNADLTARTQATYLGGSERDFITTLSFNATTSELYAAGDTCSSNFPKTAGGSQETFAGACTAGDAGLITDLFIARLNPGLTNLLQATYLGGSGSESLAGISLDASNGDLYLAATSQSANTPTTAGVVQPGNAGSADGYVAVLKADLLGDTTPDPFSFATQNNVAPNTLVTSNAAAITGITIPAPVSVAGGSYSIDGGAFVTDGGTISNGQHVQVRHTSAATVGAQTQTTLNVGGISATFTSTTLTPTIQFSAVSAAISEGASTATVTVQLSVAAPQAVTAPFALGGSATLGTEYTVSANAFAIAAGASSGSVTVNLLEDDVAEFGDSILFTLGTPTNAIKGSPDSFILQIEDNDLGPSGPVGGEGDDGGAFGWGALAGLFAMAGLRRRRLSLN
jgi:hypothetical protein